IFGGVSPVLAWLCAQPFASTEMERRRVLVAARAGQRPAVPGRLCQVKPDHLNADLWRAGKVPGMLWLSMAWLWFWCVVALSLPLNDLLRSVRYQNAAGATNDVKPSRLHLGSQTYPTWCCTRNRRKASPRYRTCNEHCVA